MKKGVLRDDLFIDVLIRGVLIAQSFRKHAFPMSVCYLLHILLSLPSVAVADESWSLDGCL